MNKNKKINKIILVLGGIRSGKSNFALELAKGLNKNVAFVATCPPDIDDVEMQDRIKKHKKSRPAQWQTIEEPNDPLPQILKANTDIVLLDCVGLLVSNLLLKNQVSEFIIEKIEGLLKGINDAGITCIIVSNEVGYGLIPTNELGRRFVDLVGCVNQIIAQQANEVYLLVSGIPLNIKGLGVKN